MSACAGSDGDIESGPEPAIEESALPQDLATVAFPLDSYEVTQEQQYVASRAADILKRQCLQAFGFEIALGEPMGKPYQTLNERFGLIDAASAELYGYQGTPPPPAKGKTTMGLVPAAIKPAVMEVLTGQGPATVNGKQVPQGGCQGEAHDKLGEGTDLRADVPGTLKREAMDRAGNDSRVRQGFAKWSDCMSKAGYRFGVPDDAIAHWGGVHALQQSSRVSAEERSSAVADVACKNSTGLLRTWFAVTLAYENELIEANAERLAQSRQMTDAVLRNATRISTGG